MKEAPWIFIKVGGLRVCHEKCDCLSFHVVENLQIHMNHKQGKYSGCVEIIDLINTYQRSPVLCRGLCLETVWLI